MAGGRSQHHPAPQKGWPVAPLLQSPKPIGHNPGEAGRGGEGGGVHHSALDDSRGPQDPDSDRQAVSHWGLSRQPSLPPLPTPQPQLYWSAGAFSPRGLPRPVPSACTRFPSSRPRNLCFSFTVWSPSWPRSPLPPSVCWKRSCRWMCVSRCGSWCARSSYPHGARTCPLWRPRARVRPALQETGVLLLFNSMQMPPPPGRLLRSPSISVVCLSHTMGS